MILSRRRFFLGLVAAPAVVHIGNLMPVKVHSIFVPATGDWLVFNQAITDIEREYWVKTGEVMQFSEAASIYYGASKC